MSDPQTDSASSEPEVLAFVGSVPESTMTAEQKGDSLQVLAGTKVTLSWTTSNADSVELSDPVKGPLELGANDSLEVTPSAEEQDYSLVANGATSTSTPLTVHISTHKADDVVSSHAEVSPDGGLQPEIVIPANTHIYDGTIAAPKFRYVEMEISVSIEAEGKIVVGKGVGLPAEDEGGKKLKIQPSGYDDGWKHAVGFSVGKKLGPFNITVENCSATVTINKEGINVAIEIEGNIYGVGAKLTFTLIRINKEWKRTKALDGELDLTIPFFTIGKIPVGPDMAVDDIQVSPHLKIGISPNWTAIIEKIAIDTGEKVAEKAIEGAAEDEAGSLAADAATNAAEGAADAAADASADVLSDAAVDAAADAATDAAATEGADSVAMIAGIDVLVASGAVLGLVWIMVKTFEDAELLQWEEDAPKKVDELAAIYLEGYRQGLMLEPEPSDERAKLAYQRGKTRYIIVKGQYYKWYKANQPTFTQAQVDSQIMQLIQQNWNGADEWPDKDDSDIVHYSEQHDAKALCENTAKATIFAAWAKEGHGGITDWPDRGNAFLAVFGKDPHHNESEMEPWEKDVWEKFYGQEYADP